MAKNKKKRLIIGGLVLTTIVLIALFAIWAGQSVSIKPSVKEVRGVSTTSSYKPLSTNLFSTVIPSDLVVKSENKVAHGNTVYQLFLSANQSTPGKPMTDQLAITVGNLPKEGISALSDIQFRQQHNSQYFKSDNSLLPNGSLSFIKTEGGYEKSSFWVHNNYYVAAVYSGTTDRSVLLDEYTDNLLKAWQWQ